MKEAATSDLFEIQSSQLAQERGNAAKKTFAAFMIKDQQKTSDDLKSMISSSDVKAELPERAGQLSAKFLPLYSLRLL